MEKASSSEGSTERAGMNFAARRVTKELISLKREPTPGIQVEVPGPDVTLLRVIMDGPADSPYEGGRFKLRVIIPEDYPMSPPLINFVSKIFHPNIDVDGWICLDILENRWTPVLQIRTVLLSIQSLLSSPNYNDPLSLEFATVFRENPENATKMAKEWTRLYAMTEEE